MHYECSYITSTTLWLLRNIVYARGYKQKEKEKKSPVQKKRKKKKKRDGVDQRWIRKLEVGLVQLCGIVSE